MKNLLLFISIALLTSSCAVSKKYHATKKFSPQQLQSDYALFRHILEESHPSLYWYTSKDSMDYYFEQGQKMLQDSLTEARFRNVLSYVIANVRCGHTSVRPSKAASRYMQTVRTRSFPLGLKLWPDTAVITNTLNKDSLLKKGTVVTAIDGRPMQAIIDTFFRLLPTDGLNNTHKYQSLSNYGGFASLYNSVYGLKDKYRVDYIDSTGIAKTVYTSLYKPAADSLKKKQSDKKYSHKERKHQLKSSYRSFTIDTALHSGIMDLNTFVKGYQLRQFFKASFKQLQKSGVQHLVIDLRGNGGGSVTNSTLLSRYITNQSFKIADSLYAITRRAKYGRYQQHYFLNWFFLATMTHRKRDNHYHFTYYEKHTFRPKHRHHFNGQVYVLTGGNTFSASTLFIQSIYGQKNVMVVGEETGGGAYGNTAWLIPDVTLPITGVRFRLPLLRLVIDKNKIKDGRGIVPNVLTVPTVQDIRQSTDFKLDKVKELIKDSLPH